MADRYRLFLILIICVKVLFWATLSIHFFCTLTQREHTYVDFVTLLLKDVFHLLFFCLMALLLLYVFNPFSKTHVVMTHETRAMLFLFGFVLLLTSDWAALQRIHTWLTSAQTHLETRLHKYAPLVRKTNH